MQTTTAEHPSLNNGYSNTYLLHGAGYYLKS